jgi:chromosome segregation ATPase
MTNPTERPEERDSLREISERLDFVEDSFARADIRTLLARIAELERELTTATEMLEWALPRLDPHKHVTHDIKLFLEYPSSEERLRQAEEDASTSVAEFKSALDRIKQMEEALRESAAKYDDPDFYTKALERDIEAIARNALDPSNTSEEGAREDAPSSSLGSNARLSGGPERFSDDER